jgi:hypothetical protein
MVKRNHLSPLRVSVADLEQHDRVVVPLECVGVRGIDGFHACFDWSAYHGLYWFICGHVCDSIEQDTLNIYIYIYIYMILEQTLL